MSADLSISEKQQVAFDVVIVGTGHGGSQVAAGLRKHGFSGSLAIIGEDRELPYERPALSKEYLLGEKSFDRIMIRPPTFWAERDIVIRAGVRAVGVDSVRRVVSCSDGTQVTYGSLVWAAGGHARRLSCPGADLTGVHYVRSRDDVDRMKSELASVSRVCIVGGGYIGLESAAVLSKLGKQVTIVEAQDRLLSRVSGVTVSCFLEKEHRSHGVDIKLSKSVQSIEGVNGRVCGVSQKEGGVIDCEIVIVGIGIVPSIEPLLTAGACGSDGLDVDENCRTSLHDVFAIGDCARHSNIFADKRPIRLESVQNATDMAATVVKSLMGDPTPYRAAPWFWSNQYDIRLQTIGLLSGFDREIVRGDPRSKSFSVIYLKDEQVRALDCINATKDFVSGRGLVVSRARISPTLLSDINIPLKEIAVG